MRYGRLIAVLCVAALASWVMWVCGIDTRFAISFGLLTGVAAVLWECRSDGDSVLWDPPENTRTTGARHDVSRLSWALRATEGRVGDAALRRVRTLAARRLERRGLSLNDPADHAAIAHIVGERAFELIRPNSVKRADRSEIDDLLARLSTPPPQEDQ